MKELQFCMSLVRFVYPKVTMLLKFALKKLGNSTLLCIRMLSAPIPQAGQWNSYSSTSHITALGENLKITNVSGHPLTANSGAAHTGSPAAFLSLGSTVGMTPSMRTPVVAPSPSVECLPQSHVVSRSCVPTHGDGQPPLALDPFTAINPCSQCVGSGSQEGTLQERNSYSSTNIDTACLNIPFPVWCSVIAIQKMKNLVLTFVFIPTLN